MKLTTPRLILALPALVLTCGVWSAPPAAAQDGSDAPERRWQTVRRGELVGGAGDTPWQTATDTAVSYTLGPDPQNANADLLTVQPLAVAVSASGRGDAAVGFGPEAAVVFRVDRTTGAVTRADGAPSAALEAVSDGATASAAAATADGPRRVTLPLDALGTGLEGLGDAEVETTSTAVTVDGRTVAHLQQYEAAPLSFTTPQGDTVLLRAGGYTAIDPTGAVVLASGQTAAGQVVTASGELLPFLIQQSSRAGAAGGGADPLSPAARAALKALLPAAAPLTSPDFSVPPAAGANTADATPPAWVNAVTTVAAGLDALATAAGAAFGDNPDPFAAARAASGFAAAATGNRINALAVNGAAGGGANTGLLAERPGGAVQPTAGNGGASPAAATLAAALAAGGGSGTRPAASPTAAAAGLAAFDAPRAPRGGASGGDALRSALGGTPAGGSLATALGGGAVYGINPVTGAAGDLPNLTQQVFVDDAGQQRSAVAELFAIVSPFTPLTPPPSSNGLTSVTLSQGLFAFSVFDSGGQDNEDVQNITLTNNGVAVPLVANGGGDGQGTTLFFLTGGQGSTFDADTNPAVAENQFSANLDPGTAVLSFEGVSSLGGNNTGAVAITSPVGTGVPEQEFELRQTPSTPPDPSLDFANLGISVNP